MHRPVIFFGAFDRHNFGDLLFPHLCAAMLGKRNAAFAGLAARDLRSFGGHQVVALADVDARHADLVHVGGELLTCGDWEAAVMLQTPEGARQAISRFDARPRERCEWARRETGCVAPAPYVVQRQRLSPDARVFHCAVGGVGLGGADPALREAVLESLREADYVSVRERHTQSLLAAAGIAAGLMPDPAVLIAELFGEKIRAHTVRGEPAAMSNAFARGYFAVQFSVDFGDEESLRQIAAQLDFASEASGYGIVLFRAGAAPWHDDLSCYARLAARMHAPVRIFSSLDVWDICALIAGSRAFAGSSLHGRILAMAYALPRITLEHAGHVGRVGKQLAFISAWEDAAAPSVVEPAQLADGIAQALAMPVERMRETAHRLALQCRDGFAHLRAAMK